MARGVHNLGRKRTEGFKKRVRAGIARAQGEGRPFGAPRRQPIRIGICEECAAKFRWTKGRSKDNPHQTTGRFCSKRCLVRWLHKHRQRLPDAETLRRLYWDEELSLWSIANLYAIESHKSVSAAMEKAGISRREKRNVGLTQCAVEGCLEPAFKIKHSNNGSMYGKMCEGHRIAHRKQLAANYYARTGGARGFAEIVCGELAGGVNRSAEIAAKTGLSLKTVTNTLTHLRRKGRVESAGKEQLTWRLVDADNGRSVANRQVAA